ncbi:alpha/beta hydrolase [Streptomyces sp. NPDC086989]|uniref:alpha/beta hydrolase n=1 Tax=Streptomyces sp. NPDC086989 TaxID=3365764 RepID=UPI003811B85E
MSGSLSPEARALCDAMAAGFPGPGDVEALRAAAGGARPAGPGVASVRDGDASGVPVRVYDPAPGSAGRPLVVFLHGGGWVICGIGTHDATCRRLAAGSGAVVVSVGYRLAPEHPWPAAADDALTVLLWARAQAGALGCAPHRVVLAGDSSGGNLAAVTALRAPELVAGQLLVYPPLDAAAAPTPHPKPKPSQASAAATAATAAEAPGSGPGSGSVSEYGEGYFHTAAHMAWYWEQYGGDPAHPYVSPLRARDVSRLPRTLLVLADCDPLRDEGLAYARRLGEAGVDCTVHLYPGVFHGFLGLPLPAARTALTAVTAWLRATE